MSAASLGSQSRPAHISFRRHACPLYLAQTSPRATVSLFQGFIFYEKVTHNHFFCLANANTLTLHDLQIFQTTENVVLHNEGCLHAKPGAFLDGEWFGFESLDASRSSQINSYV